MRDRIGFIAVGQAGGNIGQLFEIQGFPVLYLNTSMEDLSTLKGKHIYHIENGEGANKDRDKAKNLVIADYDNIAKRIDDVLPEAELIYVIFAAGGGTGSGAGPMLIDLILGDKDISVGAVTILPALNESIKAQMNAYECIRELGDIDSISSSFFLDNQTPEKDVCTDSSYKFAVNEQFAADFIKVIEAPGKYISAKGNVDTAELLETLKCGGAAIVYALNTFNLADITNYSKHGYITMPGTKGIKRALFIAPEKASLDELYKTIGEPLDEYRGYSQDKVFLMLAGMSFPTERLDKIYELVKDKKDTIMSANQTQRCEFKDFDFLSPAQASNKRKDDMKPQSRNDILKKYLKK